MEASPVAKPDGGSSRPSSKLRFSSTFLKHVSLYDWWLIRTEAFSGHHNLGVGGLISDPQLGQRIFDSATISKRHSANVLEAFDGITITIVGSINRVRTIQNGFSSEVCRHFLCGFPYYWEDYARSDGSISRASSSSNSFVPKSFHDLPISLMRDFSFSPSCQVYGVCELQKSLVKNIETSCGNDHDDARLVPPKEGNSRVTSIDSQEHEISIKNGSNVDDQHQIKDTTVEEDAVVGTDKSRRRPSTKSKSRVIKEGIQQEKNFLLSSKSVSVSVSEIPKRRRRQDGESANEENMPNLNLKARKGAALRTHSTGSCMTTTRQLTLRSRSVDMHVQGRPS